MALPQAKRDLDGSITGIDPSECALLIVDELGDLSDSPLHDLLMPPTLQTATLARSAREHGIPVIFANDAHIKGIDRELPLWGEHGIKGTPDAQPSPELDLCESDYVIEKPRYSSFFQTRLQLLLDELGVSTLIICGFDTNICVQHTAADAFFIGYQIIIVSDATETFLIGDQSDGLEYMKRCYGAKIVTTDEVLRLFDKIS